MITIRSLLKSFFALLLFVSLVALSSCGKKDDNQTAGKDSESTETSESGDNESSGDVDLSSNEYVIEYKMEGPQSNGTMTLFRMGDKFKTEMKGEIAGMEGGTATALYDGDYVYSVMEMNGEKQGFKLKVDEYKKDKDYDIKDVEKELDKYKKIGTETILGKECEIYDTGNGNTMSVYDKKAVLRIKSKDMTMTATRFDSDPDLSSADFAIPSDVEFIDMEDMMKGMKNLKNLDKLKDLKPPGSK